MDSEKELNFYDISVVNSLREFNSESELKEIITEFYSKFYQAFNDDSILVSFNTTEIFQSSDYENRFILDLTKCFSNTTIRFTTPNVLSLNGKYGMFINGDCGYHTKGYNSDVECCNEFIDWLINRFEIDLDYKLSFSFQELFGFHYNGIYNFYDYRNQEYFPKKLVDKRFGLSVGEILFYYCCRNNNFERAEEFKNHLTHFDHLDMQILVLLNELYFYIEREMENPDFIYNPEIHNLDKEYIIESILKLLRFYNDKYLFQNKVLFYDDLKPLKLKNREDIIKLCKKIVRIETAKNEFLY